MLGLLVREQAAEDRDVARGRGRRVSVLLSSVRMRPARKFVSPSLRRIVESIVRVPMIGCDWPPAAGDRAVRGCETSTVSLSVTSWLWWTRGSMSILMPTSWYWNEVIGHDAAAAADVLGVERRQRDRDAVADVQLGLLPLGDAELRLGEELASVLLLTKL